MSRNKIAFVTALAVLLCLTGTACPVANASVFSQIGKLSVDGGAVGDIFGSAVDVHGDYAAVGAPGKSSYSGAVYIYKRTNGVWSLSQVFTDPGNTARDYFGCSLDLDDSRLVVGAPGDDHVTGAAYVYTRSRDTWSFEEKLTASGGAQGDYFGLTVALEGKLAVIGAPWRDSFKGAVYTFKYSSSWSEESRLTVYGGMPDRFGDAVSLSGDNLAVGTPKADSDSGMVYVYQKAASGWNLLKSIQPSFSHADDKFGTSLSFNDGMLAVVAPGCIVGGKKTGAVLIYNRTSWSPHQEVGIPSGGNAETTDPVAVLNGNCLLVGAPESDRCGELAGEVFLYTLQENKWTLVQRICAADKAVGDHFGVSAALSGHTMLVGADTKDTQRGAAYLFISSPPAATSLSPGNNTSGIAVNSVVSAVFDQEMNASSISTSTFLVKRGTDSSAVEGGVSWDAAKLTATFRPSAGLLPDMSYTAALTSDISNAVGMKKGAETSWSFTTSSGLDLDNAGIKAIFPESRATDVSVRACVTVWFKEDMDSSTITAETFRIKGVSGTVRYDDNARKAYFIPDAELAHATVYEVALTTGVKDSAGNPLPSGQSWVFTTEAVHPDSDGDGVPDNQDLYPRDPTRAAFKSVVSDNVFTVALEAENGAIFQDVRSISPQDPSLDMTNYPSGVDFAAGLVHFDIVNLTPGAEVKVTISCTASPSGTQTVYKAGASGFYSYADHAEIHGANCILTLKDGGAGDEDLAVNGRISDPVGVASSTGSSAAETLLSGYGDGSGAGCTMNPSADFSLEWLMAALIPLLLWVRKKSDR